MGLPSNEIPLALLFFNVGVELGQAGVRRSRAGPGMVVPLAGDSMAPLAQLIPGYVVGSLGAFWFIDRTLVLLGVV